MSEGVLRRIGMRMLTWNTIAKKKDVDTFGPFGPFPDTAEPLDQGPHTPRLGFLRGGMLPTSST